MIGLIAAVQQLTTFLTGLKDRRASKLVLEAASVKLHADDLLKRVESATEDAERLRKVRESLLAEVQERIPREARRVYPENRLSHLAAAISDNVQEYEDLSREARSLGSTVDDVSASLNSSIRKAVEERRPRKGSIERTAILLSLIVVPVLLFPEFFQYLVVQFFLYPFFAHEVGLPITAGVLTIDSVLTLALLGAISRLGRKAKKNPLGRLRQAGTATRLAIVAASASVAALSIFIGGLISFQAAERNCQTWQCRSDLESLQNWSGFLLYTGALSSGLGIFAITSGRMPKIRITHRNARGGQASTKPDNGQ